MDATTPLRDRIAAAAATRIPTPRQPLPPRLPEWRRRALQPTPGQPPVAKDLTGGI